MYFIHIDAENREVKLVDATNQKSLSVLQKLVGGSITLAHEISERDSIFVDDEGFLKSPENFFIYRGAHQPFAGNGVIAGVDEEGATTSPEITLEAVKRNVKFLSAFEVSLGVKLGAF